MGSGGMSAVAVPPACKPAGASPASLDVCTKSLQAEGLPVAPEDGLLAVKRDAAALLSEQLLVGGRQLPPCAGAGTGAP